MISNFSHRRCTAGTAPEWLAVENHVILNKEPNLYKNALNDSGKMFDPSGLSPFRFPALLFASDGQEADHLHCQLQPLKVVLEILPFHREAVLLVSGGHGREGDDGGDVRIGERLIQSESRTSATFRGRLVHCFVFGGDGKLLSLV